MKIRGSEHFKMCFFEVWDARNTKVLGSLRILRIWPENRVLRPRKQNFLRARYAHLEHVDKGCDRSDESIPVCTVLISPCVSIRALALAGRLQRHLEHTTTFGRLAPRRLQEGRPSKTAFPLPPHRVHYKSLGSGTPQPQSALQKLGPNLGGLS